MVFFKKIRVILPELSIIIIFQIFLLGIIFINYNIQSIDSDIHTMKDMSFEYNLYSVEMGQTPIFPKESVEYHNRAIMIRGEVNDLENYLHRAELGLFICEISIVILAISLLPFDINELIDRYNNPLKERIKKPYKKNKVNKFLFIYGSIIWIIGFLFTQPFPIIDYTPYI